MKTLREKAMTELAGDPTARQRFLYWTWTFDAFLEQAEAAQLLHSQDLIEGSQDE